jgi:hypothetical protein
MGEIDMKILIAEDDPMLQTMAGNIMNHWDLILILLQTA